MRSSKYLKRSEAVRVGGWLFLFNAAFALAIAYRYMTHFVGVEGGLTYVYLVFLTLSHFATLAFIPFLLLYLPVALAVPRRKVLLVWGSLVAALGLGILTLDTYVYDLYRFHLNAFTIELMFGGAASNIFVFQWSQYLLVSGVLVAGFVLELWLFRALINGRWWRRLHVGGWIIGVVILMMVASHAIHAWAAANCYRPITRASRYYPLYFPTTANGFFVKMGWASPEQNQVDLGKSSKEEVRGLNYPLAPLVADSVTHTNVLLILLDSWSWRVMDSATMPHIARLAAKSEQYRNHFSGSNGTRTGVFSLFYGLPGTYWYDVLAAKTRPVLIDQMLRCHYRFGVFTSASLVSPPFDQTVFAGVPGIPLRMAGEGAHDRDIQITKDWLDFTKGYGEADRSRPFFGFLFYDAMHAISHPDNFKGPFQPAWEHPQYEKLGSNTDPTLFWNLYRNVAYFEDSLVGQVLGDLEQRGLLANTVIVITGDHGQEFNENRKGYWGHNGNYTRAQMGTPLIVHWPDASHGAYDHWTSHYDVVPTLMTSVFRCQNPIGDYGIGRPLRDTTPREWMLVGSEDNFAVLEHNRITSINFDRTFDITDSLLNELPEAKLNAPLIDSILRAVNVYYLK